MAVTRTKKSFVKMKKIKAHLVECRKTQKLDLRKLFPVDSPIGFAMEVDGQVFGGVKRTTSDTTLESNVMMRIWVKSLNLSMPRLEPLADDHSLELSEIPEDFMNLVKGAGVTSIIEFDLHSNQLSELTNELAEFRTLRCLKLSKNQFQVLPPVILRFAKIQVLDLSHNEIKELDQDIQYLAALRELDFSKNQIMTLPDFWSHLSLVVVLNVAKNRLMELPESLGSLKSLQRLDVSENLLSSLPKSLQNLQDLVTLDVHGNHLTEVPPSLGLLKNLTEFNCNGNPFSDTTSTFYSQGFEKFMDYLRNLHELQQLQELIRQKPKAEMSGSFVKYLTRHENGQRPLLRSGCSITQAGPITYIFGGRITNYVKVEETLAIDSRTLLWVKLSTSGNMPTARDGHAAAFDGNKRLYVFGGRNEENKLLNDVYYLDLKTMTWFQPAVEGSIPMTREGASMSVIGSQLIVFGGRGSRQRYNDVHVLDTQVWTWTLQNTKGSIPAPRQNAAVASSGTKLFVHGGRGGLMLDDLHVLDTLGYTWSRVSQRGTGPSSRFKHYCWIHQSRLYVVGGFDAKGEPMNSLYVLPLGSEAKTDLKMSTSSVSSIQEKSAISHLRNNTWTELDLGIDACPTHVFCHCDEKVIVFQEGTQRSEAVAPGSDEISTLEGTSWDYYLETNCDNLPQKVRDIQTERSMDNKTARVLFTMQTEFMQTYPDRRPFMFSSLNECNVEKCICTTIRPSHSDYIEFLKWDSCVSFLANFLTYEPLEDPVMFPAHLPSPLSVLNWRRADCFDFAVILASFLSGAGYEAFAVVGYAPIYITTNNQESFICPYIREKEKESHCEKENLAPAQKANKEVKNDYIHESLPIQNEEFLNSRKQDRDTIVSNFIKDFTGIFEHGLHMGQNEEEDNLCTYCNERVLVEIHDQGQLEKPGSENPNPNPNSNCDLHEQNASESVSGKRIESQIPDALDKKRLHCWVLVTSNKRDVSESFFIEPSTGHHYGLKDSPYQAVEYIWNQHNIFINMQPNVDRSGLNDMSWELSDTTKWERVLDDYLSAGYIQESTLKSSTQSSSAGRKQDMSTHNATMNVMDGSKTESGIINSNVDGHADSGAKSNVKGGVLSKEVTDKMNSEDVTKTGFLKPYHWLLPSSWVHQLKIPIEAYITRCPGGVKRTNYHRCSHELYSFYGDFVRWDGLIERIILYEDDERNNVLEIHDYFQRRKDCLRKRIFIPNLNKVHDYFDPGASFGLKETEIVDGKSRKFLFYGHCRNDGLISREEIIGKKIVERFCNHEACLIYRRASYGPPIPPPTDEPSPKLLSERHLESSIGIRGDASFKGSSISRPGSVRGSSRPISHGRVSLDSRKSRTRSRMMSRWQGSSSNRNKVTNAAVDKQSEKRLLAVPKRRVIAEKLLPIIKISQKYEQRNGTHAKDNLAKHVFNISIDQIRVDYHRIGRHITQNSHVYKKDGSLTLEQIDPFTPEMETFERLDEYHSLLTAEREAIKSIRDTERETEDILQQRLKEEQNVVLITPYIDAACVKQDDLLQEGEDTIKPPTDYLSPFLPPGVRPRQKLTRPQMLEVRDKCLGALKERLVNRATIIQARYDQETSTLSKRRANFERDREQMTVEDEETYNEDCDNALFRIRILEYRARQHEEEALQKYLELERKLQNDPRLAALYGAS